MATPTFLEDLETRVRDAAERLRSLRDENDTLRAENEKLTAKVDELEERLEAGGDGEDGAGTAAWVEEREEIRERVEALVEHLETLLDED
ncbi:MAG: cell division protein ZapB [Acidobacteriota bacterium]